MYQFTALVAVSGIYDIIWLARNEQNWFMRIVTILILILKVCGNVILVDVCSVIAFLRCLRPSRSPRQIGRAHV